jgi:transcriptional regulator with XRE-family HTH domain
MRRTSLNDLSQRFTRYLVEKRGLSLTDIAQITGVDKSFISRVNSAQREFSVDHLEKIAEHFGVELGVLLIDMSGPPKSNDPKRLKLKQMCHDLIRRLDDFSAKIKQKEKSNAA